MYEIKLFVTGATKETLTKLRICTQHFSEDMIMSYASTRRLKDDALPTLHLPNNVTDDNSVINDYDVSMENVEENSNVVQLRNEEEQQEQQQKEEEKQQEKQQRRNMKQEAKIMHQRIKVKRLRNKLYEQRIAHQKSTKKSLKKNAWEDLIHNSSGIKKNFLEMIAANFNSLPQVFILY